LGLEAPGGIDGGAVGELFEPGDLPVGESEDHNPVGGDFFPGLIVGGFEAAEADDGVALGDEFAGLEGVKGLFSARSLKNCPTPALPCLTPAVGISGEAPLVPSQVMESSRRASSPGDVAFAECRVARLHDLGVLFFLH
jgi:hypothetical protein